MVWGAEESAPLEYFDDDRPQYHVQPPAGWMNDPNGPIYYKGRYHMFYQYLPEACEWDFGIVWGHVVSSDLVQWEHLPPALIPTPGWVDADGCFSGCCIHDDEGKPMILYTGVRLRSNHEAGTLPPEDQDLGMVWIESQCAALPEDPDDDLLVKWRKLDNPFLKLPPKGLDLTGWRDPFIFQFGKIPGLVQDSETQYSMLIGAGIKGKGGTALVYKSKFLNKDWELQGLLCEGCADDTGVVWECPLLVPLRKLPKDLWATNRRSAPKWLSKASTIAEKLSSADLAKTNTNRKGILNTKVFRNSVGEKRANEGITSSKFAGPSQPKVIADFHLNKSESSSSEFNFENAHRSLDKLPSAEMFPSSQNTSSSATVSLLAKKLEQVAKVQDNEKPKEVFNSLVAREPSLSSQLKDGDVQNATQDMFEAAKAKIKPLSINPTANEKPPTEISRERGLESLAVDDDWYFFTVSPDAPTNPVLYWTGHVKVKDNSCPQFDMSSAKGPYRLDLGDILYAPNVCQDKEGRWLLWGWLQERRKVGSYAYAGCLTLPRILHVSEEGRLIQAPIPELERLRNKRGFHAQHVTLFSDSVFPIKHVKGERLDIVCSIERGSAAAAGILFRSHEAEADGSTAVIYDWCNNQLEAIFNVPPTWKPVTVASGLGSNPSEKDMRVTGDMSPSFDPASMLFTPKFSSMSRNASFATYSPFAQVSPVGASNDSPLSSRTSKDYEYHEPEEPIGIKRTGSSLSMCLQRNSSMANFGNTAVPPSIPRVGSLLSSSRVGSFLNPSPSMLTLPPDGVDTVEDEDLGTLLEDLAAPMRNEELEPQETHQEPRRVGGPLLMQPNDVLHLRIIVDHSCIEVYTGTGEVLSTRIYRGRAPDPNNPGIDFVSFGGTAILENVSAFEVMSAWPNKAPTPSYSPSEVNSSRTSFEKAASVVAESGFDSAMSTRVSADRAHALFDEILSGVPQVI